MTATSGHGTTLLGTLFGTAFCFLGQIHSSDLLKTMLLSMVGAMISFLMTLALKWLLKRIKRGSP